MADREFFRFRTGCRHLLTARQEAVEADIATAEKLLQTTISTSHPELYESIASGRKLPDETKAQPAELLSVTLQRDFVEPHSGHAEP